MSKTPRPLILLGLDAMDLCLVERWAREGALPGFRRLYATAAQGRLDSPTQVLQGSIWPSFVTGLNPGRHGLYFMSQLCPGSTELRRMLASDLKQPPFWARPADGVGPVAIVDVPKLRLVGRPGDTQVVEWGALDHFSTFATYPEAFAPALLRRLGRHPLQTPIKAPWGRIGRQGLRRRLEQGIRQKDALNRLLLERRPRMLLTVFGETHAAGHYLWPRAVSDSSAAPEPSADGDLAAVYAALDGVLSAMIDDYAGTANLILFSGHGMLADTIPSGVLETLLARMGLLVPSGERSPSSVGLGSALARLGGRLPYTLRRLANESLIPPSMQRHLMRAKGLVGVDLAASRAFVLPSDHQGFIRINLAGREPSGRVAASDYDLTCRQIEQAVSRLRDGATGTPMVEQVLRPRDLVAWRRVPRCPARLVRGLATAAARSAHPAFGLRNHLGQPTPPGTKWQPSTGRVLLRPRSRYQYQRQIRAWQPARRRPDGDAAAGREDRSGARWPGSPDSGVMRMAVHLAAASQRQGPGGTGGGQGVRLACDTQGQSPLLGGRNHGRNVGRRLALVRRPCVRHLGERNPGGALPQPSIQLLKPFRSADIEPVPAVPVTAHPAAGHGLAQQGAPGERPRGCSRRTGPGDRGRCR